MSGECSTHGSDDKFIRCFCRKVLGGDCLKGKLVDPRFGLDLYGPGKATVVASCEYGNEPSGSIKCGEFLDKCYIE